MRLHEQVKVYKELKRVTNEGIDDIYRYLNSDKFNQDIMVNKNDILMRLQELDNKLFFESIKLN